MAVPKSRFTLHIPDVQMEALETYGQRLMQEQNAEARVIKINPWFTEQAKLTVLDILGESGTLRPNPGESDLDAYRRLLGELGLDPGEKDALPRLAATSRGDESGIRGRLGANQDMTMRLRKPPAKTLEVLSWTSYLQEIVNRRVAQHILVANDGEGCIGFIDHEADEAVHIDLYALRDWRKGAKRDPAAMKALALVADGLGIDGAEAALATSRSPLTRTALLGWSPFGMDQPLLPGDWKMYNADLDEIYSSADGQDMAELPYDIDLFTEPMDAREKAGLGQDLNLPRLETTRVVEERGGQQVARVVVVGETPFQATTDAQMSNLTRRAPDEKPDPA